MVHFPYIPIIIMVCGFNLSEKYESQLGLLSPIPQKTCSKPPTRNIFNTLWEINSSTLAVIGVGRLVSSNAW